MVLACAEGRSNTAVGAELGVSDETVASGVLGLRNGDWMACPTNRAAAGPDRLPMMMWSVSSR